MILFIIIVLFEVIVDGCMLLWFTDCHVLDHNEWNSWVCTEENLKLGAAQLWKPEYLLIKAIFFNVIQFLGWQ